VKTPFEQVVEFHEKFGLEYTDGPRTLPHDLALFRLGFMVEELAEYAKAAGYRRVSTELNSLHDLIKKQSTYTTMRQAGDEVNLHDQLDALVDLAYVLNGTAYLQGFDLEGAYTVVHTANMKKIRAQRAEQSLRGSTFDVVKPPGWEKPDLSMFVQPRETPDVDD
jgi:predicted HAD superfamily Cof-like phosphohydrolase